MTKAHMAYGLWPGELKINKTNIEHKKDHNIIMLKEIHCIK
jgi:hypothetical protein